MFQTLLGQLYRLSLRSFLGLRLRSQHLLRDLLVAPLADARDGQFDVGARNVGRRRASPRRKRPSPARRTIRRRRRADVVPFPSQPVSREPSSTSGGDCSTNICAQDGLRSVSVAVAVAVPAVAVPALDSPSRPAE